MRWRDWRLSCWAEERLDHRGYSGKRAYDGHALCAMAFLEAMGFCVRCVLAIIWKRRGRRDVSKPTVGGGLGDPSESSTFVLVRFDICSNKKARSRRILLIARRIRDNLRRAASFASSTSFIRVLS